MLDFWIDPAGINEFYKGEWAMKDIDRMLACALNEGASLGIGFIEARWGSYRNQYLAARDQIVNTMMDEISEGMSVRVFHKGAWGFAAASVRDPKGIKRLVKTAKSVAEASARVSVAMRELTPLHPHTATWKSPVAIDPFKIPLQEKIDLLLHINAALTSVSQVQEASSFMRFHEMVKYYANSLGSRIDQTVLWSDANYSATAVGNDRCETRDFQSMARAGGYESIMADEMLRKANSVAHEAVEQLTAAAWDQDTADLILLPNHTRLVIHETIGHATELDRVLGWEADYAGTSFATPDKLNHYRYGSPLFSVTADRTQPGGLATCAFDDEGSSAQCWKIIDKGILTGYSTTRDTAPLIGAETSCGCAFADHWQSFPILRMANIGIDPGSPDSLALEDLIADTSSGILVDGMAAFSIDHQRMNFQFSGDYCRRIHKGRIGEPLWNVVYDGSNPGFWSSMDAVCKPAEWLPYGVFGCAKGQPVQIAASDTWKRTSAFEKHCCPEEFKMKTDQGKTILDRVIAMARKSGADHVAAVFQQGTSSTLRFARNQATQHKTHEDTAISLAVALDNREAMVESNRLDRQDLETLVSTAMEFARKAPQNPEFVEPVPMQEYSDTIAWFESTAQLSLDKRGDAVGEMCRKAEASGMDLFGNLEISAEYVAVANSSGLFVDQPLTEVSLSLSARTRHNNGSSQAHLWERDWKKLKYMETTDRTIAVAAKSENPKSLEPGHYTVILSPKAISEYLMFLIFAMDARMADMGQSFFGKEVNRSRLGDRCFQGDVTISSAVDHLALPMKKFGQAFGSGGTSTGILFSMGLPAQTTTWIENGEILNFRYSPYYAQFNNRKAVAYPFNLVMKGGESSLDDLIAGVERGLLIESFWYVNPTDWNRIELTGLTRDGTFLIENGKISGPVNSFRFNDSPVSSLNHITGMTPVEKIHGEYWPGLFPWVRISDFHLSSVSNAV